MRNDLNLTSELDRYKVGTRGMAMDSGGFRSHKPILIRHDDHGCS